MKTLAGHPTAFDSFNARNISPAQVAETFIPPSQFEELAKRSHSLLIGPRGSGKTTLLKMLHPSALGSWNHPKAEEYRNSIDYTGIFIPSDVMWSAQIGSLGAKQFSDITSTLLSTAAFTTSVLEAFIDSVAYRVKEGNRGFRKVNFDKKMEEFFAKELSLTAKLKLTLNSIDSISYALSDRRAEIYEIASKAKFKPREDIDSFVASHEFLHIDFLATLTKGVEVFNRLADEVDGRWALLFDELEIAPEAILNQLLSSLRSTNQKLIFKLSISPYHEEIDIINNAVSAMVGQDYKAIRLWFPNKVESRIFSEQLLDSLIKNKLGENVDFRDVFDSSDINLLDDGDDFSPEDLEEFSDDNVEIYKIGGRAYKKYKQLYEEDLTFKSFIDDRHINLNSIHELSPQVRAQFIRKIAPIVYARLEFRKVLKKKVIARSRKNPIIYSGANAILAITEGNPRWLIGLVNSLLIHISDTGKVSRVNQSREITKLKNRFRALIKTIPCDSPSLNGRSRGVLAMIDVIGETFHDNVIMDSFSADPAGSFVVDSNIDPLVTDSLGRALNQGAIVYIPISEDAVIGSLKGKRFRLSYLLATGYRLPLTQLRSMSLSSILMNGIKERDETTLPLDFGDEADED